MLRAVTRSWRTGGPAGDVGAAAGAAAAAALRDSARSRAGAGLTTTCSSCVGADAETATPERAPASGPSVIDPEYPIRRSRTVTLSPPRGLHCARNEVASPLGVSTAAFRGAPAAPGSSASTSGKG